MKLLAYLTDIWTRLRDRAAESSAGLPTGVDPDWLAWRETRRIAPNVQRPDDLDEVSLKFARAL